MRINEVKSWVNHHTREIKPWVMTRPRKIKSWVKKESIPITLQAVVNGSLNALCARIFTSVSPAAIGVFVASATVVHRTAHAAFKYDHEKVLEGDPRSVLNFAAQTIIMIKVPHAMTTSLGYKVAPNDCLKVGLITIATVALTMVTLNITARAIAKLVPSKGQLSD